MSLVILYGIFSLLPLCSAVITCRVACRRCRENAAYPDMLEVYCAMCEECKERRREWLEGPGSNLDLRVENRNINNNLDEAQDDCSTPATEDPCEEKIMLTKRVTTSTTTTTTTTHRPCTPKPHCIKTTRAPCFAMPCPIPIALSQCNICPGLEAASPPGLTVAPQSYDRKLMNTAAVPSESMYFYVGVPKKLINDFKLLRS